jgi:hypothetical protein
VRALGLLPGTRLQIVEPMEEGVDVVVLDDQASIRVPIDDAAAIWVEVL